MMYRWKEGSRVRLNPTKAGKELVRLKQKNGLIHPDEVVRAAKSKRSALHGHFEWDDQIASAQYRLAQAQHLIRCLVVLSNKDAPEKQAFFGLRRHDHTDYVHRMEVARNRRLAEDLLAQAKMDMNKFTLRYEEIRDDLSAVFSAIEDSLDEAA